MPYALSVPCSQAPRGQEINDTSSGVNEVNAVNVEVSQLNSVKQQDANSSDR